MSVTVQLHDATPARVDIYGGDPFLTIGIGDGSGNKVTVFFPDQATAADWLRDALAKVESATVCGANDPDGHGVCEKPTGHAGNHHCQYPGDETVAWPKSPTAKASAT